MAQYQKLDAVFDSKRPHPHRIFLFDVDGTLTQARKKITPEMHSYFEDLRKKVQRPLSLPSHCCALRTHLRPKGALGTDCSH